MPASDTAGRLVQLAQRLFEWYLRPSDAIDVLRGVLNNPDVNAALHSTVFIDYPLLLKRIYRSDDFARIRESLLRRWTPRFEPRRRFSAEDAQCVLREWLESLDHELLFCHAVLPGRTHAQKNVPASDFVTSYHATRSAWTLHLTVRGAVEYFAGVPIVAKRGDFVLISPDASVHYKRQSRHDEWLHYWAVFQPEPRWTELMQWPARSYGMHMLRIEREQDIRQFEALFEQMFASYADTQPLLDRLLGNLLEQILIRAQALVGTNELPATDARVLKASDYMYKNLQHACSVAEVAAACNLSESRLSHLFQQHLGMGVQKYRNCLRVQVAKRLLATGGAPIAVVARQAGYADPAQFSKFFARSVGCSPRQFRAAFSGSRVRSPAPYISETIGAGGALKQPNPKRGRTNHPSRLASR